MHYSQPSDVTLKRLRILIVPYPLLMAGAEIVLHSVRPLPMSGRLTACLSVESDVGQGLNQP